MDIFKKLMDILGGMSFEDQGTQELATFIRSVSDNEQDKIVTMATTESGEIVLSVFTPDQWDMANHIAEVSDKTIPEVVYELSVDGDIATFTIDPRED
jgi:hypothetical protein